MRKEDFRQSLWAYDHTSEVIQQRRERARVIAVAAQLAIETAEEAAARTRVAYARGELTPVHSNDVDQLIVVQPATPTKRKPQQQHNDRQLGVRRLSLPNISGISAAPRNYNFIGFAPKRMTLAQLRTVISCDPKTLWCYACKLENSFMSLVIFQEHIWQVHNINLALPSHLPRKFSNSISLSEFPSGSWENQCYKQESSPGSNSTVEFLTPPQDHSFSAPPTPTFQSKSFVDRLHSAVTTGVTKVALDFVRPEAAARLSAQTTTNVAVTTTIVQRQAAAAATTSVAVQQVLPNQDPSVLPPCPIHAARSTDLTALLEAPGTLCTCPEVPPSPDCPIHAHPSDWLTLQTDSIACTCKNRVRPNLPLTVPINVSKEESQRPRTRYQGVPQGHYRPYNQEFVPKKK